MPTQNRDDAPMEDQAPTQTAVDSMDIDQDSSQNTQPCYLRRNYGSKKVVGIRPSIIDAPTNLEGLFEEYKAFSLLKKKDDMASNLEVGSAGFVVSNNWLKKYADFILFDQFRAQTSEHDI